MASILAYIEVREGAITSQSRFVLAEARRVAEVAGATVYGLVTVARLAHDRIDELAADVCAAGADRVLCCSDEAFVGPPLDMSHGALLVQLVERLRPLLVLLPAGGVGAVLGPPLAVRLRTAYMPSAGVEVRAEFRDPGAASQRVIVRRWRAAGNGIREIDVADAERPVVAVLAAGHAPDPRCQPYPEVEMIPYPEPRPADTRILSSEIDDSAHVELCSTLIWAESPVDDSTKDGLRRELPPHACLLVAGEPGATVLPSVTPSKLLLAAAVPEGGAGALPTLAPGQPAMQLRSASQGPPSATPHAEAGAAIAELTAAIRRARAAANKGPA